MKKNLLLLAVGTLLGFAAAELVARSFYRSEVDAERIAEKSAATAFGAFTRPSTVPGLVYELRPGTRLNVPGLPPIAISDHGPYRIPETGEEEIPAGALRVAVIGDSTPFGWRVSYRTAYPEVLRRSLEERSGRPVAVRNFSVPGYNSEQERTVIERHALPWRPHLVLLHYDHNDWEPGIREKPASYLDPAYGDNPLHSAVVKLVARRLRIARQIRRYKAMQNLEHRLFDNYAYEGPLYTAHLEQVRRIAEAASDRGIPVVCLVFDAFLERSDEPLASEHYRLLHRGLFASLTEGGCHVLEMFHPYQRLMADQGWRDLSKLWVAPDDGHPNELGHALIAQALERFIVGNALLGERSR